MSRRAARMGDRPALAAGALIAALGTATALLLPVKDASGVASVAHAPIERNVDCEGSVRSRFCRADVLILGDSHAGMYRPAIEALLRPHGGSVAVSAAAGCPPVFHAFADYNRPSFAGTEIYCADLNAMWARETPHAAASIVVLGARWEIFLSAPDSGGLKSRQGFLLAAKGDEARTLEASRARFELAFRQTVAQLVAAGKKVVVLGQLPLQKAGAVSCAQQHAASGPARGTIDGTCGAVTRAAFEERSGYIRKALARIVREQGDSAVLIDPAEVLCRGEVCSLGLDGRPAYANDNHVNAHGAALVIAPASAALLPRRRPAIASGDLLKAASRSRRPASGW